MHPRVNTCHFRLCLNGTPLANLEYLRQDCIRIGYRQKKTSALIITCTVRGNVLPPTTLVEFRGWKLGMKGIRAYRKSHPVQSDTRVPLTHSPLADGPNVPTSPAFILGIN